MFVFSVKNVKALKARLLKTADDEARASADGNLLVEKIEKVISSTRVLEITFYFPMFLNCTSWSIF